MSGRHPPHPLNPISVATHPGPVRSDASAGRTRCKWSRKQKTKRRNGGKANSGQSALFIKVYSYPCHFSRLNEAGGPPGSFLRLCRSMYSDRGYRKFVLSMRTPRPAARPTLAFRELRAYPLDVRLACLGLLHRGYPANPFIAGKRSDVLPRCTRFWRAEKRLSQIRWYRVQRPGREFRSAHALIITAGPPPLIHSRSRRGTADPMALRMPRCRSGR